MTELVVKVPDNQAPGYLRRLMAANKFSIMRDRGEITPEYYENLIVFLLAYIVEPEDRDEAREALLDASADDYGKLLDAVAGRSENPTLPEKTETS